MHLRIFFHFELIVYIFRLVSFYCSLEANEKKNNIKIIVQLFTSFEPFSSFNERTMGECMKNISLFDVRKEFYQWSTFMCLQIMLMVFSDENKLKDKNQVKVLQNDCT